MKSLSTSVALLQLIAFLTLTASAPTSLEELFRGVDERANEISSDKTELKKHFRETYVQRVKSFMNASMDPCVDFYEYACGNFSNVIVENESERKRNNLLDIEYILLDNMDQILMKERDPNDQYFEEMQTAKKFMDTCVSSKIYPMEPSTEYLNHLKDIGGFPAVDPSWEESNFDAMLMSAHLVRYGIEGLVKENIYLKHPFPPIYEIGKFGFEFDVNLENIKTNDSPGFVYSVEVMKDMLAIYGVNGSKADQVIEDIMIFWKKALELKKEINDNQNCEFTFDEVLVFWEAYNAKWMNFIQTAWNSTEFKYTEMSSCPCFRYFMDLEAIIKEMPKAVANYMALKFLYSLHPRLKSTKFQRTYCLTLIKRFMPLLFSHFYLEEHYKKDNEDDLFEIISELQLSLKKFMETADWLDEPTRNEALEKVKTLKVRKGKVSDPITDKVIKEIQVLKLSGNFATDILELSKFVVDISRYLYQHQHIPHYTTPLEIFDALQVNAFNYVVDNSINVCAGILNLPVYHEHMPRSVKYGALGYILGHELTHGFDSSGSYFDSNLEFRSWWTDNSTIAFQERSNCFAEHYNKFKIPELNLNFNGSVTLDENIADSGGLREAYSAYRNVYKNELQKGKDDFESSETLPGLNLSPEQTFFLSFAQIYCSKYTPKQFLKELASEHPLDKYRILGSLQNFEEFGLAYDCPLGSPMNPNEKCRLW